MVVVVGVVVLLQKTWGILTCFSVCFGKFAMWNCIISKHLRYFCVDDMLETYCSSWMTWNPLVKKTWIIGVRGFWDIQGRLSMMFFSHKASDPIHWSWISIQNLMGALTSYRQHYISVTHWLLTSHQSLTNTNIFGFKFLCFSLYLHQIYVYMQIHTYIYIVYIYYIYLYV